jgi:trk system potassium uptake protein TrkH
LLTFLGGCSGSTSGAIKTFRLQILWEIAKVQWKQLLSPHSINNVRYDGKAVEHGIQAAIAGFFTIYIAIWMILGVVLQMTGLDFVTAFTGSASAISNVGPGLGDMIGPSGTFSAITPMQAWIFSLAMLLGRIEFMALFVLLLPSFWRD